MATIGRGHGWIARLTPEAGEGVVVAASGAVATTATRCMHRGHREPGGHLCRLSFRRRASSAAQQQNQGKNRFVGKVWQAERAVGASARAKQKRQTRDWRLETVRRCGRDSIVILILQRKEIKGSGRKKRTGSWPAQTMARAGVERREWQCLSCRCRCSGRGLSGGPFWGSLAAGAQAIADEVMRVQTGTSTGAGVA